MVTAGWRTNGAGITSATKTGRASKAAADAHAGAVCDGGGPHVEVFRYFGFEAVVAADDVDDTVHDHRARPPRKGDPSRLERLAAHRFGDAPGGGRPGGGDLQDAKRLARQLAVERAAHGDRRP